VSRDVALGEGGGRKGVRVENVTPDGGPSALHLQGEVESYRELIEELRDRMWSLEEPSCRGGRMSRHEEIEKLLADVEPRLEALRESALEEIRQDQQRAEANVRRYDEAVRELLDVEAEISRLSAEREQLAFKTYQAWLDSDRDVTARLRASFRDLRSIIDGLQKRRLSLKGELSRLSPRGQNHRYAAIEQLGGAAGVASSARAELEELRDRLMQALDTMVQPVSDRHDALRGRIEQLDRDRAWEESPVEREGVRV
jgi:chromosome segregation ATPase